MSEEKSNKQGIGVGFKEGGGRGREMNGQELTFADVPLLYEAPQHVGAAMAVRRLVKRLLAEAVPMAGWSLSRDRRHVPRSTAAPLTPDFHREATQGAPRVDDNIITRQPLRDLETVRVHNCVAAAAPAAGRSGPSRRTVVLVVA